MKYFLAPVLMGLSLVAPSGAQPALPKGVTRVTSVEGITEYQLANGLRLLVFPDSSKPTITVNITYLVGSRHEGSGEGGMAHLLEHMVFKGSPKHTNIPQELTEHGASPNGTTSYDRTNYYETFQASDENLKWALDLEADRMVNSFIRKSDLDKEFTVVRNEFEIGENDPVQALDKEIFATAYQAHPYHHSTIGWRSDIEKVSIEKLREFYNTFYWPNNATATIVGDFDPAKALGLIKKYYGIYPKSPRAIPQVYTEEPAQTGPRRVMVQRAGELGTVGVSYKSPAGSHPDYPALQVLGIIMGSGKTSRFFRALTDKNLTTNVVSEPGFFHDPTLFQIYASLAPGAKHDAIEKIIVDELARVKTEGVTDAEVATAAGKIRANTAYGRDGSFAIASNINEHIAAGDWTLFVRLDQALGKVTAADVKRVANIYLNQNQSTTGWFVPVAAAPDASAAPSTATAAAK